MNVGSLRGKDGEVVSMAVKGHLDFRCLQETRWRGEGTRKMGAYKLFWMRKRDSWCRDVGGQ